MILFKYSCVCYEKVYTYLFSFINKCATMFVSKLFINRYISNVHPLYCLSFNQQRESQTFKIVCKSKLKILHFMCITKPKLIHV